MIQKASINAAQDEAIFCAKYSPGRVGVILIIYCLLMWQWLGFTYDLVRDIYDGIAAGKGFVHFLLLGSILLMLLTPVLGFGLDLLLFREIIFYPNRVEIVRWIFRRKIVYYSNATVEKGGLGYLIDEVREKKRQRTRFLYDVRVFFFPPEARQKVETIFDYLSGDSSTKNPRVLEKSVLPREVLLDRRVQA